MTVMKTRLVHICDFCGKSEDQVNHMVAGPGYDENSELSLPLVDICGACIDVAYQLVKARQDEIQSEADA